MKCVDFLTATDAQRQAGPPRTPGPRVHVYNAFLDVFDKVCGGFLSSSRLTRSRYAWEGTLASLGRHSLATPRFDSRHLHRPVPCAAAWRSRVTSAAAAFALQHPSPAP